MFESALSILHRAVEQGVIPSAAVAIGRREGTYTTAVFGNREVYPTPVPADVNSLYDMASLTKTMATAMVALRMAQAGEISLYDTIGDYLNAPADKHGITLLQLLTHNSGMPAHVMLRDRCTASAEALELLLALPLEKPTGADVIYSCLGYIVLGKILEQVGGAPLDVLARRMVFEPLGMRATGFCPGDGNVAATEFDATCGCYIKGEVHDENARFLGGVSGNAGLFSTVGDCASFATMLACGGSLHGQAFLSPAVFTRAISNHTPGIEESRGIGFSLADGRPLSCGEFFSRGSFGHTGFTGTSIWVDRQSGLWVVLLSNAVHFGRDKDAFLRVRRMFHNAVAAQFSGATGFGREAWNEQI